MRKQFKGTGVALVTPFNSDKSIDFEGLKKVIEHCIEGGLDYLVTLGTTGETVVLNNEEKQAIIDFTVKTVNGRVPIVAGFGGGNTQQILDDLSNFNLSGIDAILSSSPNYNKPSQEGIYQHYKSIAEHVQVPLILYNVPSRTAKNIAAKTTIRLANEFDNIVAIKEASNDMLQCMEIAKHTPDDFLLISGDDIHALPMYSFGSQGVISVIAQATPKLFTSLTNAALAGNFEQASQIQFQLNNIIQYIFEENNPAGIKAALHKLGLIKNELRLPIVPVKEKLYDKIATELEKLR